MKFIGGVAATAMLALFGTGQAHAAECEPLDIGSAISLTGKYATNGIHAKNGYEFAIKKDR